MDELEVIVPGPESGPPAARSPEGKSRASSPRVLLVVALVAALGITGLALTRDRPASAAQRLVSVQQFLDDAVSVRFESSHEVGEQVAGATYRTDGALRFPGWARRIAHSGSAWDEETIRTDRGRYQRRAGRGQKLAGSTWTYLSPPEAARWAGTGADGEPDFGLLLAGLGPPLDGEPDRTGLTGVIRALKDPARVDDDTIRASLPLTTLFTDPRLKAAMLDGTGKVDVELTVGPGGRLERMGWSLTARRLGDRSGRCNVPFDSYGYPECVKERAEIRFSRWNEPLDAFIPDITDVDVTPGVDEENLASVPAGIALAPSRVPDGIVLREADLLTEGFPNGECRTLVLIYGPSVFTRRGPYPNLDIRVSTGGCLRPEEHFAGSPGRSITAGRYRGTVYREAVAVSGAAVFGIGVAQVTVEWGDLPENQMLDAMASLAPLDLATQPVYQSIPPQY